MKQQSIVKLLSRIKDYLLNPRIENPQDNDYAKRVILINHCILLCIASTLVNLQQYVQYSILPMEKIECLTLSFYFISLVLLRYGKFNFSRNIFAATINFDVFISCLILGSRAGSAYYFFPIAIGSFILFGNNEYKRRIIFTLVPITLLGITELISIPGIQMAKFPADAEMLNYKMNELTACIITIFCAYYFLRLSNKIFTIVKQEKASLQSLIENINDNVWQIDTEYKIVNVNSTFKSTIKEKTGIDLNQGDSALSMLQPIENQHPDNISYWKKKYDRALAGEMLLEEQSFTDANGKTSFYETSFTPVFYGEKVTGVVIVSKNITVRKEQEIILTNSLSENKMLALVASNMHYSVMITDSEYKINWVNSGFNKMTGYSFAEAEGKYPFDLLTGRLTTEATKKLLLQKLSYKKPFELEYINYRKTGEPFWVLISVSPQLSKTGEVEKYITVSIDISDRKRSEEQLQMLLQHSQKLNKQLQSRDQELQESLREMNKQSWELQLSQERLRKQKQELERMNSELSSKALLLSQQNNAISDKNTQLERTKKILAIKATQLEQSSRYKSEFLANMSHELRTPLNSIIILSRLLSENKDQTLNEKQLEFSRVVNKSGTDLLNLINDILDLSKIEAGRVELGKEEISINEIADDIQTMFLQVASEKGVTLNVNTSGAQSLRINTDPQRLSQILKNLLSNAFKFTPKGGTVTLTIKPKLNNHIEFSVIDTGIGIPAEKHKLIFESFKQVDGSISRKYGGTGLGLSISKELTRLLDGEITVNSEQGKGSIFTVTLPSGIEHTTEVEEKTEQTSRTLLIIEDDETYAGMLEKFALQQGFRAEVCHRGDTGYMRIRELMPDAVLLDMNLPGMDGWSILRKMVDDPLLKNIPVHVISSAKEKAEKNSKSVLSWLEKPVSIKELKNVFETIKEKLESPMSKVLLIEDSQEQSHIIRHLLSKQNIECTIAENATEALQKTGEGKFDCIILDLNLPDSDGIQVLKTIKEDVRLTRIPVIVYSARELTDSDKNILRDYASSYIRKSPAAFDSLMEETQLFLNSVKEQNSRKYKAHDIIQNTDNLKGRKVLIVDDDSRNIYAITSLLEMYDIELYTAANGHEAISELEKNPDIEMVFMDIMMPEMDGYEATKIIRKQERFSKLPIVALTAKAMKGDHQLSINSGMNDHITKPIEGNKLILLMNSLLQ